MGTMANPILVSEKEQAMDFFHGLDQGKYRAFKAEMMNGWNSKVIKPPTTLNEIYKMAGSWVKTNTRPKHSLM